MSDDDRRSSLGGEACSGATTRRRLAADTAWFTLLFGASNVLSYVYLVVAGRRLAGADFGVFNALLGVVTLAGVVANAVQTAVTAAAVHDPSRALLAAVNRRTARLAVPLIAALTLAALPLAPRIGAGPAAVVVCGAVTLVFQLAYPSIGFMIGMGLVREQAWIGLAGTLARLATGVPLMIASGGVVAGLLGYLGNYLVVLALGLAWAWRRARPHAPDGGAPSEAARAHDARLGIDAAAMAAYVAVFVPFSLDQLLVQLVAPHHGSAYAALSTMSKLVFLAAYPLIATAFPAIVRRTDLAGQLRVAGVALAGVVAIAGAGAAALAAQPRLAVGIFFGDRFPEAVAVLPWLAAGAFAFALSVLGTHVLIAWRNRWAPLASLLPSAAGVALYASRHATLGDLVADQCAIYAAQLAGVGALVAVEIAGRRRSQFSAAAERP